MDGTNSRTSEHACVGVVYLYIHELAKWQRHGTEVAAAAAAVGMHCARRLQATCAAPH